MPHKILIVDDDHLLSNALALSLKEKGFDTVQAMDALSAVVLAEKHSPDLVIMDFKMPAGTGVKVYERLQAARGTLNQPVIFLSGFISQVRGLVPENPNIRLLSKPLEFPALLACVHELLRLPPPAGA